MLVLTALGGAFIGDSWLPHTILKAAWVEPSFFIGQFIITRWSKCYNHLTNNLCASTKIKCFYLTVFSHRTLHTPGNSSLKFHITASHLSARSLCLFHGNDTSQTRNHKPPFLRMLKNIHTSNRNNTFLLLAAIYHPQIYLDSANSSPVDHHFPGFPPLLK